MVVKREALVSSVSGHRSLVTGVHNLAPPAIHGIACLQQLSKMGTRGTWRRHWAWDAKVKGTPKPQVRRKSILTQHQESSCPLEACKLVLL